MTTQSPCHPRGQIAVCDDLLGNPVKLHPATDCLSVVRSDEKALMKKHDVGGNRKIDMDELREILTDLDKEKRPPLPKNRMFFLMLDSLLRACFGWIVH